VRQALEVFPGRRVAVSPIVAGAAVKGPAAKIMTELGKDASVVGVAREYAGICDYFLIDHQDSSLAPEIAELGINPVVDSIIMHTNEDKVALAQRILKLNSDEV
jgi:LPPG:FO 2-phospho-L-lactate transferase